jgi:hypothetical protein
LGAHLYTQYPCTSGFTPTRFLWANQDAVEATYDHLVSVDGDEASIDTQFITFAVAATRKPEGGWPVGTFGAQGTIKPIESGYYPVAFRRTDGAWRIRHLDVIHDIPYVF